MTRLLGEYYNSSAWSRAFYKEDDEYLHGRIVVRYERDWLPVACRDVILQISRAIGSGRIEAERNLLDDPDDGVTHRVLFHPA